MKLIKKIEIICMNGGGWNATTDAGPWATDTTPELALQWLLKNLSAEYQLAEDARQNQPHRRKNNGADNNQLMEEGND